jgi:acetyl-CoA synthetase
VSIRDDQTRFDGPDTRGAAVEIIEVAAVVPAPDPPRLTVPKAYSVWRRDGPPSGHHQRDRRPCASLPKTISGKIRRVELRVRENSCQPDVSAGEHRDR